jgi:putative SOS response-associated peptidase YedK
VAVLIPRRKPFYTIDVASRTRRVHHHRMPIVLNPANYAAWLDQSLQEPERIEPLLRPHGVDALRCHAVSTWVNNPKHEGQACVAAF